MYSARLRAEATRLAAGEAPSADLIPIVTAMPAVPDDSANRRIEVRRIVLKEDIRYVLPGFGEHWADLGSAELPVRVADVALQMGVAVMPDSFEGKRIAQQVRTVSLPRRTTPEQGGKVPRVFVDVESGVLLPPPRGASWPDDDREARR